MEPLYEAIGIHWPCSDGSAAGYVLQKYAQVTWGITPPSVCVAAGGVMAIDDRIRGKKVVVVDVFPKNHAEVAAAVKTLQVLDHHAGARDEVLATPYGAYSATRSGVGMAWEYVYGTGSTAPPMPAVLAIIEEKDLNRFTCEAHKDLAAWLNQKIDVTNPDQTAAFAELDLLVTHPHELHTYDVVASQYAKMIRQKCLGMIRDSRPKTCVCSRAGPCSTASSTRHGTLRSTWACRAWRSRTRTSLWCGCTTTTWPTRRTRCPCAALSGAWTPSPLPSISRATATGTPVGFCVPRTRKTPWPR